MTACNDRNCANGWTNGIDESYSSLDRMDGSLTLIECVPCAARKEMAEQQEDDDARAAHLDDIAEKAWVTRP